jgi:hypothetical protein
VEVGIRGNRVYRGDSLKGGRLERLSRAVRGDEFI